MFTLQDAKNLSQDKLSGFVIDEFRKSPLLDIMVFDDTVKPQGGSSLTYSYNRVTTLPTAAGRAIGTEYMPQESKTTPVSVALKVFGGAFQIDRVLQNDEKQVVDLIKFQLEQKTKATRALFGDWFINGDAAIDATSFDGLDKALTGSTTERKATALDLSSAAKIELNWKAFLYELRQTLKLMDGAPSILGVNSDMFSVFQTIADYSTQFTQSKNELGSEIVKWGAATIMDMGDKAGTSTPIIETATTTGLTDIYIARIGLDGVHGVTPTGNTEPKIYLPNMSAPGAVKKGEVELVAAVALKATRAAAVLRGVKIM
ncbi:MAG: phage capsid protein [Oscillospiraceae bacterium]